MNIASPILEWLLSKGQKRTHVGKDVYCTLLVGMWTMRISVTITENSMGVFQKTENEITVWSSSPTSANLPQRLEISILKWCLHFHVHYNTTYNSQLTGSV